MNCAVYFVCGKTNLYLYLWLVDKLKEFLSQFYTSSTRRGGGKDFKYAKQITALANREQVEMVVDMDDLVMFDDTEALVENIERNAKRY